MNKEEKIYQFNEYILGYDKGLKDRSCLTISKSQNDTLYVMASLYDGSADVINTMLDSMQQEITRLNNIINTLEKELKDIYEGEYSLTEKEIKNKLKELKEGNK